VTKHEVMGWHSVVLALVTTFASVAAAERITCEVQPDGTRYCATTQPCTTRSDCLDGASELWSCISFDTPDGPASECGPACSTAFECSSARDCPTFPGLVAACQDAEVTSLGMRRCTYRNVDVASPPSHQITYCADGGARVQAHFLDQGDCDGDGCPNGADNDPCMHVADGSSCTVTVSAHNPLCPPPPILACEVESTSAGVLMVNCDEARPCLLAGHVPCGVGTCDASWTSIPRCRAPCGTAFACAPSGEPCPPFGGETGTCATVVGATAPYLGVCVYPSMRRVGCASGASAMCQTDAHTGAPTSDFYAGDCDGDGVPNGCDAMVCGGVSGPTMACFTPPGPGCGGTVMGGDAGVLDAGGGRLDGGNGTDAASDVDAAQPSDAGQSNDAAQPNDAASASDAGRSSDGGDATVAHADAGSLGFTGGGGCACHAGPRQGSCRLSHHLSAASPFSRGREGVC
jgi:hypothetical protein